MLQSRKQATRVMRDADMTTMPMRAPGPSTPACWPILLKAPAETICAKFTARMDTAPNRASTDPRMSSVMTRMEAPQTARWVAQAIYRPWAMSIALPSITSEESGAMLSAADALTEPEPRAQAPKTPTQNAELRNLSSKRPR